MNRNFSVGFLISEEDGSLPLITLFPFISELSLDQKTLPFTINMKTWLITWMYSSSFVHSLILQNFPSMKEACGVKGPGQSPRGDWAPQTSGLVDKFNKGLMSLKKKMKNRMNYVFSWRYYYFCFHQVMLVCLLAFLNLSLSARNGFVLLFFNHWSSKYLLSHNLIIVSFISLSLMSPGTVNCPFFCVSVVSF